jgi:hypothetical protein
VVSERCLRHGLGRVENAPPRAARPVVAELSRRSRTAPHPPPPRLIAPYSRVAHSLRAAFLDLSAAEHLRLRSGAGRSAAEDKGGGCREDRRREERRRGGRTRPALGPCVVTRLAVGRAPAPG